MQFTISKPLISIKRSRYYLTPFQAVIWHLCVHNWYVNVDYSHMIPHLVSFTPRRNLTSFSFSSSLSRVAIVFSISAVLVPIICHLLYQNTLTLSLSQSFPVSEGSLSVNLFFAFPPFCCWFFPKHLMDQENLRKLLTQLFSLSEALRQPIALTQ